MKNGELYELQPNKTYSLFDVEYDYEFDRKYFIQADDQVPKKKILLS